MKLKNNDLVSIICPVYNCSNYIEQTIESVCNQTYDNWELIIVDDCSTDNTYVKVNSYINDLRIKLFRNKSNNGPAFSRNIALKNSIGRWIAFLDGDDLWAPNKIETSLYHLKKNNCALVFSSYRRISYKNEYISSQIKVPTTLTYFGLLCNTAIVTSSVVIDSLLVPDLKMKNTYYDDFACWLSILKKGFIAYGINDELVYYRILKKSFSRNKIKSIIKVWIAMRTVEKLNFHVALWCFSNYLIRAFIKYLK